MLHHAGISSPYKIVARIFSARLTGDPNCGKLEGFAVDQCVMMRRICSIQPAFLSSHKNAAQMRIGASFAE
jgi:hypothetical protein